MSHIKSLILTTAALIAIALASPAAIAGNTNFLTEQNGAQTFPFSPPNKATPSNATIDATDIGQTTQAAGAFSSVKVDSGTKTATASAGAATLNKNAGVITTEALTTAAGATYTLTLTDSAIAATDQVMVSVQKNGSTGTPVVTSVDPAAGSVVIIIQNIHASAAFNAALKVAFVVVKN